MIAKTASVSSQFRDNRRLSLLLLSLLALPIQAAQAETPTEAPAAAPITSPGSRVCVLLPTTGRYASLALAIRLGIEGAAKQQSPTDPAPIQVYDTQGQPADAVDAYDTARKQGCPVIVGPLLRPEAIAILKIRKQGDAPIIPLAPVSADASRGVYPFGLAPELEAVQMANDLWEHGYRHPAMLYTDNELDKRLHSAFLRRWTELGGKITADQLLPPGEGEVLPTVQKLLGSPDTPDAIILLAPGHLALALAPLLRQQSGQLPIFGSSRLNAGHMEVDKSDIPDGLAFLDMPWILSPEAAWMPLRQELLQRLPGINEVSWRLSALGFDSYQLAQRLVSGRYVTPFLGATGVLRIMPDGKIHRRLSWGVYKQGKLQVYASLPEKHSEQTVPPAQP